MLLSWLPLNSSHWFTRKCVPARGGNSQANRTSWKLKNYSKSTQISTYMQNFHLHCTSRIALAFTITLNPFSAVHQYFPDLFLFTSKLSVSPWPIVVPSFSQVIFGVGFPVAEQLNVTVSDSITVWFVGFVIKLGATAKLQNIELIFVKHSKFV